MKRSFFLLPHTRSRLLLFVPSFFCPFDGCNGSRQTDRRPAASKLDLESSPAVLRRPADSTESVHCITRKACFLPFQDKQPVWLSFGSNQHPPSFNTKRNNMKQFKSRTISSLLLSTASLGHKSLNCHSSFLLLFFFLFHRLFVDGVSTSTHGRWGDIEAHHQSPLFPKGIPKLSSMLHLQQQAELYEY